MASLLHDFVAELGCRHDSWIGPQASLERDLGLGSLERVELLSRVESEFQIALPEAVISEVETAGDLVLAVLKAEGKPLPPRWEAAAPEPPQSAVPDRASSPLDALYFHAAANPARPHLYLRAEQKSDQEQIITYGGLARGASDVARELRRRGVGAGDRVAIMLPTGEDFFYCFLGVQLAQAIPVPMYPPYRADRIEEFAARQTSILRDAEAGLLITFERVERLARLLRPAIPSLADVVTARQLRRESAAGRAESGADIPLEILPGAGSPALIQYTSGSTGNPKGVLLTHANLMANIRALGSALGIAPGDSGVSWLPLYHDMGLIGCWLLSLFYGMPLTVLSPMEFLSRPERWLWAIHRRRATLSVAPNFAYDLCARKVRDEALEGLDLSCVRLLMNGSESVRAETIGRFTERFSPYGLRPEVMLPVYGLAESTVALCVPPLNRMPRFDFIDREALERRRLAVPVSDSSRAVAFASVGTPIPGHEIRIVDDQGNPLPERVEGHIQFRGPSSMSGYFRRPDATAAIAFGEWLDTGDLGYWADGELFVTGRAKDLILKGGRNLCPQEIEALAAEVPGVRKGCVAAFGVYNPDQGTEKLVIAAETRERGDPARERGLRAEINRRLSLQLGMPADDVVLLSPGMLPKTSSGKLRRDAARQAYQQGTLALSRARTLTQWTRLCARWAIRSLAEEAKLAARALYSVYCYALFGGAFLAGWVALLASRQPTRAAQRIRLVTRILLRFAGIQVHVQGLERLEPGPLVFVANHASYLDALVLVSALPRPFLFVAKKELASVPLLRTFLRKLGYLLVDRNAADQSLSDTGKISQALRSGSSVLVFPEGTFTRAPGLRPFRLGAFKAAAEAGFPISPVAIRGSRLVLPDQTWILRRFPVEVVLRPPVHPQGTGWREVLRLRDAAFAEILASCGEPRLDLISAAIPGS